MTDETDEDVESLADAVEDWKQAKYFIRRLRAKVFDGDVDYQAFRAEFMDTESSLDRALMDLLEEIRDEN